MVDVMIFGKPFRLRAADCIAVSLTHGAMAISGVQFAMVGILYSPGLNTVAANHLGSCPFS